MSKFNRIILAIAAVCLVLGILICILVGARGGWNIFARAAESRWNFSWGDSKESDDYSANYSSVSDKDYETDITILNEEIRSVNIDIPYGELTIEQGDEFLLKAEDVIKGTFKKKLDGGVLTIEQNYGRSSLRVFGIDIYNDAFRFGEGYRTPKIKLTVPKDFKAEDFILEFGAGKAEISGISAEKVDISLGAGNVRIQGLSADDISIDTGVGNLIMDDVALNDLDLSTGVGNTEIQGTITGDSSFDCGVGRVYLDLEGDADDYNFDVDQGVGTVTLNGSKITSRESDSAKNSFDIEGGVGEVVIKLK